MKRVLIIFIAILMSFACVGCKTEEDIYHYEGRASNTKSMVVFDEKEFSPDEAYATVYFGANLNSIYWETFDQYYAYAFFIHEKPEEYNEDMWSEHVVHESRIPSFEWETSLYEEILSKPLNEMSEISEFEKPVFIVHHQKKENENENYLESYRLTEEYNKNTGLLKKLQFNYWCRVKLPEEFFEAEEGDFTFVYEIMDHPSGEKKEWYQSNGQEEVSGHYEKKDGKIVLQNKVIFDRGLKNVTILNLEEE